MRCWAKAWPRTFQSHARNQGKTMGINCTELLQRLKYKRLQKALRHVHERPAYLGPWGIIASLISLRTSLMVRIWPHVHLLTGKDWHLYSNTCVKPGERTPETPLCFQGGRGAVREATVVHAVHQCCLLHSPTKNFSPHGQLSRATDALLNN